ncbi:hypothetical protein BKA82DRAFT_532518 [Pisolithus tinctorius]|uniref:Uncharacterized protein n=1 Tax=Pisolithus tinctorius Marx 270 TaxID=870435 RepID=A0A0C3PAV8_PISTI|nr:hypothetical protein BKA82DRAFT_532518 [Pisolithus tinctorius]KIO05061.1 hypothetical protein M404DRAFT_532518 [Pisolithus tinctorius Marx 270]
MTKQNLAILTVYYVMEAFSNKPLPSHHKPMRMPEVARLSAMRGPAKSSERGPGPLPTCPKLRADPRAPITTPSRPAGPKLSPPKEQVHLRHTSLRKESTIPVPVRPRRLVDLRHWSPSKHAREQVRSAIQPRSSSGGVVKDLIKCFEGLGQLNSLPGNK